MPREQAVPAASEAAGVAGTVLLVGPSLDLAQGSEVTGAACGLAAALRETGYDVRLVGPGSPLASAGSVRAVVSLVPRAGIRALPTGVPALAWCIDDVDAWLEDPVLELYDVVLAPSPLAARALRDRVAGKVALLPPAIDPLLARQAPSSSPAVDRPSAREKRWGIVTTHLLEVLAATGSVRTTSRLAAVHLGLDASEPIGRDDDGAAQIRAVPSAVVRDHSFAARAATMIELMGTALTSGPRPLIGCFPEWVSENPYQQLLYADVIDEGVRVVPVRHPAQSAVPRDDGGRLDHYALHVHWTAPLLQPCRGPVEAVARLDAFRDNVIDLRSRGGRLIWTVHNVLPHDVRWWSLEVELARFLADQADLIHVLDRGTAGQVRPLYELPPDKVVVVPHSSYVGVYPDVIDRSEARARLGLEPDEPTLLLLGGLRPYKGLEELLDAFDDLLAAQPRARLLLAGKPSPQGEVEADLQRALRHPRVLVSPAFVPDDILQVWFRAADVCVLPYRDVLNSGSFQLALTFGAPAVVPALGTLRALADPAYARTFEPGSRRGLVAALESALAELTTDEASHAATSAALANSPAAMAAAFRGALAERMPALLGRNN